MNKKLKNLIIILITVISIFTAVHFALALDIGAGFITNSIALGNQDPRAMVAKIINVLLAFLAVVAIIIMIYAGWLWMTSGGAPDKIAKAKKTIIGGLIGLIIILASWGIVWYILTQLIVATGGIPLPGTSCLVGEIGNCNGCMRCVINPLPPPDQWWQPDVTCPGCGPGIPTPFQVTTVSPGNAVCPIPPAIETVVNTRIRIWFNYNVDPNSVPDPLAATNCGNLQILGNNTQCPDPGVYPIDYTCMPGAIFNTFGNMVEFIPDPAIGCPVNTCGATECFDLDSRIHINIPPGLLQSLGPVLGVQGFNSQFFTNDLVDCAVPTVNITTGLIQQCLDTNNNLGSVATDDSGVSQVDFSDSHDNSAFTTPINIGCGAPPCGKTPPGPPWTVPLGTVVWHPTAGLGYSPFTNYTITVTASDLDANTAQSSYNFNLKPAHCCNLVQDVDEDGIDCGGADCAGCVGAACGDDLNKDCAVAPATNCTLNNNRCYTGFCDCIDPVALGYPYTCQDKTYAAGINDCCICQDKPIIDWVRPAGGFCNEDVNLPCLDDGDCATFCDTDTPNGAVGNFITVGGRNFGAYIPGSSFVYFSPPVGNPGVQADWPSVVSLGVCPDTWTDNQIIVAVPAGAGDGPIRVVNGATGYEDLTNDIDLAEPIINDFIVNTIVRPGLCLADNTEAGSPCNPAVPPPPPPVCGYLNDTFNLQGINFTAGAGPRNVLFGNPLTNVPANNVAGWANTSVNAEVPNITAGNNTVFIRDNNIDSNPLLFETRTTVPGGPVITYINPTQGPAGQYITIYGNNFGTAIGKVEFDDGFGGWVLADTSFPLQCQGNWWHDSYIVVKVPAAAPNGPRLVHVIDSILRISNDEPFTKTVGTAGPGLCLLSPYNGNVGDPIDAYGDHFLAAGGSADFWSGAGYTAGGINSWADQNVNTDVPAGAQTGPFRITDSGGNVSNTLPFTVGACDWTLPAPGDCLAGDECCGPGTTWVGRCRTVGNCGIGAGAAGGYGWSFTTGPGVILSSCSAISGAAACNAYGLCPNVPGECRGRDWTANPITYNVCDDAYCNATYTVACGGNCAYDLANNQCYASAAPLQTTCTQGNTQVVGAYTLTCTNIGVSGPNAGYWQMSYAGSCPAGMYREVINNLCTLGTPGSPNTAGCDICDNSFSCSAGQCWIGGAVCAGGTICSGPAGTPVDTCVANQDICECCCRTDPVLGLGDCCLGLTCEPKGCGDVPAGCNPAIDPLCTHGLCSGCRVELDNPADWSDVDPAEQAASDASCNCPGHSSQYCRIDLSAWPGTIDRGVCVDMIPCDNDINTAVCDPNNLICTTIDPNMYCDTADCYCKPLVSCDTNPNTPACEEDETICTDINPNWYCDDNDCICRYMYCDSAPTTLGSCNVPDNAICIAAGFDICDPVTCTCRSGVGDPEDPCIKVNPGPPVVNCVLGEPSCRPPLICIEDLVGGPPQTGCRCCCDPGDPTTCPANLDCFPNQGLCTGANRGLCCGCTDDGQCAGGIAGCGGDTCCHGRPSVTSRYPLDDTDEGGVPIPCTNTIIKATFNEEMKVSSFSGNMIVIGDYDQEPCPDKTTFMGLAKHDQDANKNKLVRIFNKIRATLRQLLYPVIRFAQAYSGVALPAPTNNYCAVHGVVTGYNDATNSGVIIFNPDYPLDPGRRYHAVIKGDNDLTNANHQGVLNQWDIGMEGGASMVPPQPTDWPETFNATTYTNAHIWSFTVALTAEICRFAYVNMDPASKLFQTSQDDVDVGNTHPACAGADDDDILIPACYDKLNDRDKVFYAEAREARGFPIAPMLGIYDWTWGWSSDNGAIAGVVILAIPEQGLVTAQNVKEGKTYIRATATIGADLVFDPTTAGTTVQGKAPVYLLLCENPWPPIPPAPALWAPWGDTLICSVGGCSCPIGSVVGNPCNCGFGPGNCQSNCSIVPNPPNSCPDTQFEVFYCRDQGAPGTADDLPAILSGYAAGTQVIRGTSGDNVCTIGNKVGEICLAHTDCGPMHCSNNSTISCTVDGDCGAGNTCEPKACVPDFLKEIYYKRETLPTGTTGLAVTDQTDGGHVLATWPAVAGVAGYKLYWGTASNNYSNYVDMDLLGVTNHPNVNCFVPRNCDVINLTDNTTYYFNLTSYTAQGAESDYYGEVQVVPTDATVPIGPFSLTASAGVGVVGLTWPASFDLDVVGYKVYYGTATGVYGGSHDVGNVTGAEVTGLSGGVPYFFMVAAYDAAGNEGNSPEASATPFAKVTIWTFQDSWDRSLGQWCSPGPGFTGTGEGTQHNLTDAICTGGDPFCSDNGGDWYLGPDAATGGTTFGFGENAANLDGNGPNYDGMLISDPIYISQTQTNLHLWRHVDLRSFDDNGPDAYYLEIWDSTVTTILDTVDSWVAPGTSLNYSDTGVIDYNITAFRGQVIRIAIQAVGHSGAGNCSDAVAADDGLVQISDVYIN